MLWLAVMTILEEWQAIMTEFGEKNGIIDKTRTKISGRKKLNYLYSYQITIM